ncbi:MAG: RsmE family RNA methyltransferase [Anaerohalosphaeraceae bacterium]
MQLDPSESHHLAHVLRIKMGETVEVFDGRGRLASARVSSIQKDKVSLILSEIHTFPAPAWNIILAVSMAKANRFDFLVEKCTELGVDHIIAVVYERTVKMGKESTLARYEKIAVSAAKQSGRVFLPRLSGPWPLSKAIEHIHIEYPQAAWIYGEPSCEPSPQKGLKHAEDLSSGKDIVCLVGPEGGFTEAEKQILQTLGACSVQINPNVLRIETAAIAFGALSAYFRS